MKKGMLLVSLVLLCITTGLVTWHYFQPVDPYVTRQVIHTASNSDKGNLLDFYPHISKVKRPRDSVIYPIAVGEVGPAESLYSGPKQYPFFCMTLDSGLGQPEIDNQNREGVRVYQGDNIVGYSKDCGSKTALHYFSLVNGQLEKVTVEQTKNLATPLYRVEQGTINRFIYAIIMPITPSEVDNRTAHSLWNKRLIYQFHGGSGIGYRQGRLSAHGLIENQLEQLKGGYAVISSSGNKTSYTYNMLLAEDTAARVKRQFVSLYGEPLYTVGIGGSGGGLAQYLLAQNGAGILDGLIPLYSYPDMITQTTYALDCDLLNNYFTFRAKHKKDWRDWERRRQIEGMNAINDFPQKAGYLQPLNQLMAGFVPDFPDGSSECINGYFGLSSFINNPRQGFLRAFFSSDVVASTKWSYWQDLSAILGLDEQGFGRSTWDNVGVQYGLQALKEGEISVAEFLHLNRHIGAWLPQAKMQAEDIIMPFGHKLPIWLSLWGNQNVSEVSPLANTAARHQGDITAMQQAYRSGQVFIGKVWLPIIDARHYLENQLDMHHMSASFYSRLRIQQATGQTANHVIWVADKNYDPTTEALALMDKWQLAMSSRTLEGVVAAKPAELEDTCFGKQGETLAKGGQVFDGTWNNRPPGTCLSYFPMYSTSRIVAGAPWAGDLFKCALIPVASALDKGLYGTVDMSAYQTQLLEIFPDGVCDYQQRDQGRPSDL
ncbi:DUF6351 family protein [Pseudoalteromonas fenneropenaei]|uniref:DUF6351 family protein n=1 Tax=Pseudoalteromonas fenneropenaei TaxID=1737459 RepID=A0ABV7CGH4_9GAMM